MDHSGSKLKYTHNENVFEVEDILTNILARLPVKSLLICKSVCKYWRGLISSPSFMQSHLLQSQQNPSYVFYPYPIRFDIQMHLLIKIDGETTQSFPDRFHLDGVICSFNGLICGINRGICNSISHSTLDVHICNPATRQGLLLPPTPRSKYLPKVGVSFGPTINEYKIFQFFDKEEQPFECKVYSSITRSWKSIGTVAYIPCTSLNHVCINGIVYWFSKSKIDRGLVGHILAVDREEKFSIIRIPEEETIRPFLVNLEGCLCLVVVAENGLGQKKFDIWALQDSKQSVWVKRRDYIPIPKIKRVDYVAVRKNEILFGSESLYLFYDMETKTWREFDWEPSYKKFGFSLPIAYTESLLPCNGCIDP